MSEAAVDTNNTTTLTPAGIEVRYTPSPKRMYEVRRLAEANELNAEFVESAEWREVPSVTTVLGVLDKPGLPWWGMKTGIEGVLSLLHDNLIYDWGSWVASGFSVTLRDPLTGDRVLPATVDSVTEALTLEKLTVNHVRDKAGSRGQAVHDAFETWATTGTRPDPSIFPDEERGYVLGLLAFLDDVNPEPLAAEVMVGSVEHGYAGRYDIRLRVPAECQVVFHRTPKRGPQYATLKPGVLLGDLKTSKDVYVTHSLQLEAYEAASIECGYEPTEARGILNVTSDGHYKFVRSRATADDFLCVLAVYRMLERLNEASKAKKKVLANLAKPIQERGDEVLC